MDHRKCKFRPDSFLLVLCQFADAVSVLLTVSAMLLVISFLCQAQSQTKESCHHGSGRLSLNVITLLVQV